MNYFRDYCYLLYFFYRDKVLGPSSLALQRKISYSGHLAQRAFKHSNSRYPAELTGSLHITGGWGWLQPRTTMSLVESVVAICSLYCGVPLVAQVPKGTTTFIPLHITKSIHLHHLTLYYKKFCLLIQKDLYRSVTWTEGKQTSQFNCDKLLVWFCHNVKLHFAETDSYGQHAM